MSEHVDVLVVGAGLSGIGAAVHLQRKCPEKTYLIVEARKALGGTWDLFRYPGIRSDSDMHTLGYNFKPWVAEEAIAAGPAILDYVRETAAEYRVEDRICFEHKVVSASWDSADSLWKVDLETPEGTKRITCHWLHMCAGYYRYDQGYTPDFEGRSDFRGDIIHPQHWPENYDYADKKVVVIGSGATAMTLVPAMTDKAAKVTMVQRSPTYVVSRPSKDRFANRLRKLLPGAMAYGVTRWRNVLVQLYFYNMTQKYPKRAKSVILNRLQRAIGDKVDVKTHFTPRYNPWEQRLCLIPDDDLFDALRENKVEIVTDHIERLTEDGLRLASGKTIEADLIITATGLDLQFIGGAKLVVDGEALTPNELIVYRNAMLSGVPNMTAVYGYTNASWTLRADLTSEFMCRMLKHMEKENFIEARPVAKDVVGEANYLSLNAGYIERTRDRFPTVSSEQPWVLTQNYAKDIFTMRFTGLEDKYLHLRREADAVLSVSKGETAPAEA